MTTRIRIGTRRSPLALWQSEHVKARLEAAHPGLEVELVHVVTTGDRIQDRPLATIGGKALFVKEIEERLQDGSVDLAVHSMKDVPAFLPDGLGLVATSTREDPADAFVARDPGATPTFDALPEGAKLGTGSLRRTCQLKALRPDLQVVPIRGNVDTRLRKLEEDGLHGVVLASAGLKRLGLGARITEGIAPERCLPAVGQGALAIETRLDDARTKEIVSVLHDPDAAACVDAERGFLSRLEGGCQVPIAAYAVLDGDTVHLRGLVGRPDGTEIVRGERRGPRGEAKALGEGLATELLGNGAAAILEAFREAGG